MRIIEFFDEKEERDLLKEQKKDVEKKEFQEYPERYARIKKKLRGIGYNKQRILLSPDTYI